MIKQPSKLAWRHDNRFADIDKRYFANHLGRERKAENLRMSLSYMINDQQIARMSSGMSIAEMTEDYRPDDYIAQGKHGFASLLSPSSSRAISYKSLVGKKSNFEMTFATGKYEFAKELFTNTITVENTVLLNRFTHHVNAKMTLKP